MNTNHLFRAPLAALLLTYCASRTLAPAAAVHPGFDVGRYPGETVLRTWKEAAPYEWVGYYLPAPCHKDASWSGKRESLQRAGWGVAVLYVGQQAFGGAASRGGSAAPGQCSSANLTAERGRADAQDAIRKTKAEGFSAGSVVFLDVQPTRRIPPELVAYYRAWTSEVLRDGYFLPGTYADRDNAAALYSLAQGVYRQAGRADSPPFWVSGGTGFSLNRPPSSAGHHFADVWQGRRNHERTWGGVTLKVDENVAEQRSPSAPPGED